MRRRAYLAFAALCCVYALSATAVLAPRAASSTCDEETKQRLAAKVKQDESDLKSAESEVTMQQLRNTSYFLDKGVMDPEMDRALVRFENEAKDARRVLAEDRARYRECGGNPPRERGSLAPPLHFTDPVVEPVPLSTAGMDDFPAYDETFTLGENNAHVKASKNFRWLTFGGFVQWFAPGWLWLACPRSTRTGPADHSYDCNYTFRVPDPKSPGAEDRGVRVEGRAIATLIVGDPADRFVYDLTTGGVKTDFTQTPPTKQSMGSAKGTWTQVKQ